MWFWVDYCCWKTKYTDKGFDLKIVGVVSLGLFLVRRELWNRWEMCNQGSFDIFGIFNSVKRIFETLTTSSMEKFLLFVYGWFGWRSLVGEPIGYKHEPFWDLFVCCVTCLANMELKMLIAHCSFRISGWVGLFLARLVCTSGWIPLFMQLSTNKIWNFALCSICIVFDFFG